MKKLLTAAVASTFAFLAMGVVNGDEIINQGADFEAAGFVEGAQFNAGLSDDAQSTGDKYWYTEDTEADNVISNYPSTGTGVPIASRPDKFASDANTKFLKVETSGKLWRSVKNNSGSSDFLTNTVESLETYGHSLTDSAIYLDTLVKFTPADSDFSSDLTDGDKIAISYVEREEELDSNNQVVVEAATNFVIRAGLIVGGELFQTNYYAYLPGDPSLENFDKDAWHRLTVRTIPDVGDGSVGFVVYVDETNLTYATSVDAGFGTLDATAQGFYNSEKHALFPSAVGSGAGKLMISAASFSGNGSIDDVVFTTTTPGFIEATESVVATINLGTGISGVTVSVSGTPVEPADSAANPLVFNLAPGTTDFTLAVTADTANGYTFDDATGITAENASYANGTVTISGGSPALTVVGKRDNAYYMDGETKVGFATLTEAFATAPAGTTLKLGYDYSVADNETTSPTLPVYTITKNLVLDLNGKTLDGGSSTVRLMFNVVQDVDFTVIDSVVGDTGSIVYGGTFGIFGGDGNIYIGSTTLTDYGPVIEGWLLGDITTGGGYLSYIFRGKFSALENTVENDFDAALFVNPASNYSLVGDYWVVEPQGGSTTFALTTTGGANATITTDPADVSALAEETEVTITATAAQDYTYYGVDLAGDWTYDSQTDAISMTTNISENTTVVVPDAVSEQSQEDWPEGKDLDDVAGKAAGDQFPGITNALATADAKAVATWAEANNVEYAAKGSILPEAFLLNCANTQAAIDEAAANFKVTAITVSGDTVTITPADGADYGNGKVVIEGTATLSPISWHEKTDGDHFFRATLVVKPVAAP